MTVFQICSNMVQCIMHYWHTYLFPWCLLYNAICPICTCNDLCDTLLWIRMAIQHLCGQRGAEMLQWLRCSWTGVLISILPTRYMHCLSGFCCWEYSEVMHGTEREEYKSGWEVVRDLLTVVGRVYSVTPSDSQPCLSVYINQSACHRIY